jgi:hypothetical protein
MEHALPSLLVMHLLQLLVPLADNAGQRYPREKLEAVISELTQRFGGITAYLRSPAIGLWQENTGAPQQDELVVCEVMTDALDVEWWKAYRARLEASFNQEKFIIRVHEIKLL